MCDALAWRLARPLALLFVAAAVSACPEGEGARAPFLIWEQPSGPGFVPTGPALDLGAVDPAQPAQRRLALFNAGDAPVEVSAIGTSEPDVVAVSVNGALPRTLRPGSRVEVFVTATPASACPVEVGLLVDAPGGPTLALGLRALAARDGAPDLSVALLTAAGPTLVAHGAAIDFGARLAGDDALRSLVVTNVSGCPVVVDGAELTPTPDFALPTQIAAVELPPGGGLAIPLAFRPEGDPGARQGLLTLTTSAGSRDVPLAGRVGAPSLGFRVGAGDNLVRPSASGLDFGAAELGARVRRVVRIVDEGAAPVEVTAVASDRGLFEVGWGAGEGALSLAAGASWDVPVTFVPDAPGSHVGTLTVTTPAGAVSLQLVGTGLAGALSLAVEDPSGVGVFTSLDSEGRIDFGAVEPGSEVFRRVKVENVGDGGLTVTSASASNGFRAFLPVPVALEPGEARDFLVRFRPVATVASYDGALEIKSDRGTRDVALSGALTHVCAAPTAAPAVEEGPCVASSTVLCLLDGRFAVTAANQDTSCGGGVAEVATATDAAGVLTFGGGWDVIVNLVDACEVTGYFGLTAAAPTRDRVELRVVDTVSGAVGTWFSPLGEPFQPLIDPEAFDTCP